MIATTLNEDFVYAEIKSLLESDPAFETFETEELASVGALS